MTQSTEKLEQKSFSAIKSFSILGALVLGGILISSFLSFETQQKMDVKEASPTPLVSSSLFGFDTGIFDVETITIKQNQFLATILQERDITYAQIQSLVKNSKDIFNVRSFRSGKDLTFIRPDECSSPTCMIYEPSQLNYIKYDFIGDSVSVQKIERDVTICVDQTYGRIQSSLSATMDELGLGLSLISKMEDALASSVDFYHLQRGDEFKIIYEEIYIEGEKVKEGNILGAYFRNQNGEHYSVYFENERYGGFYDLEGHPAKGAFLRAPVKFSRISSGYNPRRFHPIKKKQIPHLGTDYAAPTGTPIFSVADGVVTAASYTANNGKYVKIKHDNVYQTQYLHMNGFASGIKSGVRVKQGQVIGYVGSTGLATGPHVCFRFWKNGQQINHLRENFPPAEPLPASDLPEFTKKAETMLDMLNSINPLDFVAQSQTIDDWNKNKDPKNP